MSLPKFHTFKILDHGYVKFIDSMGTDETIIEAARMSTGRDFVSWEAYERCVKCEFVKGVEKDRSCILDSMHTFQPFPEGDMGTLEFLYSNKHLTPFEMCEIAIEVKAPLFVFREWHRHRTQSYNEFSARYAQMANEHYVPEAGRIQKQSTTNKQGSAEAFTEEIANSIRADLQIEQEGIYKQYDELVKHGVAKEIARLNTPVSRYSKMRAKTDLRNWLSFLLLRKASGAQWEIRQYADAVGAIIRDVYPRTYELFMEHTFEAVTFSRTEMKALRSLVQQQGGQLIGTYGPAAGLSDKKAKAFLAKLQTV